MPEIIPLIGEVLGPLLGGVGADIAGGAGLASLAGGAGADVLAPLLVTSAAGAGAGGLGTALGLGALGAGGLGAAAGAGAFGGGGDAAAGGVASGNPAAPGNPAPVDPTAPTVDPITVTAGNPDLAGSTGVGNLISGTGTDVLTQLLGQQPPQQPFANQSSPGGTTQSGNYNIQNTTQGADGNTYTYDPTTGGYVDQNGLPMGAAENQQIDQAAQAAARAAGTSTDSVGTTVSGLNVSVPAGGASGVSPLTGSLLGTDAFGSTLAQLDNGGFQVTAPGNPTTSPLDVVAPGAATGLEGLDVVAHPLAQPNVSPFSSLSPFLLPFLLPPGSPDPLTGGGGQNPNIPNLNGGGGAAQPGVGGGAATPKPAGTPFGSGGVGAGTTGGLPTGVTGSTKPKIFPWVTPDQGGSDVQQSA